MIIPDAGMGNKKGRIMSEEKKEVLRMLSEGIIDVDGAERLLAALDKAAATDAGHGSRQRYARPSGAPKTLLAEAMDSIRETISGIGPAVRLAINEDGPEDFESDEGLSGHGVEIDLGEGGFPVEKGDLVKVVSLGRKSAGDLTVECLGDGGATVSPSADVRAFRDGDEILLLWKKGDLALVLPEGTGSLKARSRGGSITVTGTPFPVSIKTMGGNLSLIDVSGPFHAKTMGGNMKLGLKGSASGSSSATTMGGNIEIGLDPEARASLGLELETMGGRITGDVRGSSGGMPGRASYRTGEDRPHQLKARTMGGDIITSGGSDA